jgi:hypothetical protein
MILELRLGTHNRAVMVEVRVCLVRFHPITVTVMSSALSSQTLSYFSLRVRDHIKQ